MHSVELSDYSDIVQLESVIETIKQENNYQILKNIKCCGSCKNYKNSFENKGKCILLSNDKTNLGIVFYYAICNKYRRAT
jgi:hypothetical protein